MSDYYEYHESRDELARGQVDKPVPRGQCNVSYQAECSWGFGNVCCALTCEVRCGAACDCEPDRCEYFGGE